jgi:hypothetical protein
MLKAALQVTLWPIFIVLIPQTILAYAFHIPLHAASCFIPQTLSALLNVLKSFTQ